MYWLCRLPDITVVKSSLHERIVSIACHVMNVCRLSSACLHPPHNPSLPGKPLTTPSHVRSLSLSHGPWLCAYSFQTSATQLSTCMVIAEIFGPHRGSRGQGLVRVSSHHQTPLHPFFSLDHLKNFEHMRSVSSSVRHFPEHVSVAWFFEVWWPPQECELCKEPCAVGG